MRNKKAKTSLIFKLIVITTLLWGNSTSLLAQLPTNIQETAEIDGDLIRKFCINLSDQSYNIIDPKLSNSPGLPIVYSLSDTATVTIKILMDALEIDKVIDKELQPRGTHIRVWDGKDKLGKYAATGKYRVLLYAKRKNDNATCSAVLEFWVARLGITGLGFENSVTSRTFPMKFHRQSPTSATDFQIPEYEWSLKSLDLDAETVRPLPQPHDDYPYMGDNDTATTDESYSYPVAYKKGSNIRIKLKVANDSTGFRIPAGAPEVAIANPWYTVDRIEVNSGYVIQFEAPVIVTPNYVTRDSNLNINIRFYYHDGFIWRFLGQQTTSHILYTTWKEVTDSSTFVQVIKWSSQWAPSVDSQIFDKMFADHYVQRNILEQSGASYQFPNSGALSTGIFLDQMVGACGNWAAFFVDLLASQGIYGVGIHHLALGAGTPWYIFSECMRVDSIQAINNFVTSLVVWDHVFCNFAGEIYDPSFGNHFVGTWEDYFYSIFELYPVEIDDVNPSYWLGCHGLTNPGDVQWFQRGAGSNYIRIYDLKGSDPSQFMEQTIKDVE